MPTAIVLLSGGLDSATTLAIARREGFDAIALCFAYGQRHAIETHAARRVATALGAAEFRLVEIDLRALGGSALTADLPVPKAAPGAQPPPGGPVGMIPLTYVPARNTIFLSYALALAEVRSAADIFIGVNAVDFSGYPDCRPEYIAAFERLANLATRMGVEGRSIRIHAPLIAMTKSQIIARGLELGVDYALTRSCYDPDPAGRPCGACESCGLRRAGFAALGLTDPVG